MFKAFKKIGRGFKRGAKKGISHIRHKVAKGGKALGKEIKKHAKDLYGDVKSSIKNDIKAMRHPTQMISNVLEAAQKTNGNMALMTMGAVNKHLYDKIQPIYSQVLKHGGELVENISGGKIPAASTQAVALTALNHAKDALHGHKPDFKKFMRNATDIAKNYAATRIHEAIENHIPKPKDDYSDNTTSWNPPSNPHNAVQSFNFESADRPFSQTGDNYSDISLSTTAKSKP